MDQGVVEILMRARKNDVEEVIVMTLYRAEEVRGEERNVGKAASFKSEVN